MNNPRLFIGLPVPSFIQKRLLNSFKQRKLDFDLIRLVDRENIHITIKFLGPTPIEMIPELISACTTIEGTSGPFDIETRDGLVLPRKNPSALGISVVRSNQLNFIFNSVEKILTDAQLVQPERRQFNPHITLARVSRGSRLDPDAIDEISQWMCECVWTCNEIVLFESQLTSAGPVYISMNTFSL